jgi:hypothetical protein
MQLLFVEELSFIEDNRPVKLNVALNPMHIVAIETPSPQLEDKNVKSIIRMSDGTEYRTTAELMVLSSEFSQRMLVKHRGD